MHTSFTYAHIKVKLGLCGDEEMTQQLRVLTFLWWLQSGSPHPWSQRPCQVAHNNLQLQGIH